MLILSSVYPLPFSDFLVGIPPTVDRYREFLANGTEPVPFAENRPDRIGDGGAFPAGLQATGGFPEDVEGKEITEVLRSLGKSNSCLLMQRRCLGKCHDTIEN